MKGIALIHLTFEGLQVDGGGVCTVNRGHLAALPSLQKALSSRGLSITPFFCETLYANDAPGYDETCHQSARSALEEMGGELYYVLNRTDMGRCISCNWPGGEDFFGTTENTLAASVSGATLARNISMRFERALVYCDDAAFVMAPQIGAMQANDERIQWIWVVHSTSATHDAKPLNPEKVGMEAACVNAACDYPNIHLGAISRFIEDHLVEEYAAPRDKIIPTGNGVNPLDEKYRIRSREEIESKINQVNQTLPDADRIPLDQPLVFSFGRPVPYKRLDLTLRAAAKKPAAFHPVVVTLGEHPELHALKSELNVRASIINAFDFELAACLCQHEQTLAVAILAKNEPFGLIPSEARLLVRRQGGVLVVPSDGGGLAEQVTDGNDGFVIQHPEDPAGLCSAVDQIRSTPADRIREAGVDRVFTGGYTWSGRIMETLSSLYEDVAAVRDDVLLEITSMEKKGL